MNVNDVCVVGGWGVRGGSGGIHRMNCMNAVEHYMRVFLFARCSFCPASFSLMKPCDVIRYTTLIDGAQNHRCMRCFQRRCNWRSCRRSLPAAGISCLDVWNMLSWTWWSISSRLYIFPPSLAGQLCHFPPKLSAVPFTCLCNDGCIFIPGAPRGLQQARYAGVQRAEREDEDGSTLTSGSLWCCMAQEHRIPLEMLMLRMQMVRNWSLNPLREPGNRARK